MSKDLVGYRFSPTGEELINDYLKNKNLGKTWLVKEAINEIKICSFEPKCLPQLSKIKSDDLVWYFFSPKEYANSKKTTMKRTTGSGFWKPTGRDRTIKDKRGSKIGIKKTLVYHEGKVANGVRTPWVMHEYHITCLPPNKTTYVLCQVKYKGDHGDISFGGNDSVVSQSNTVTEINTVPEVQVDQPVLDGLSLDDLEMPMNEQDDLPPLDAFDPNTFFNDDLPNLAQQTPPYGDDYWKRMYTYNGGNFEDVISDQVIRQENRNVYTPKKALSGIIVDCSSNSDCGSESISAMSYQGTSSPHDSVGSSNKHFLRCSSTDSCKDLQTSADLSVSRKTRECQLIVKSKKKVKRKKSRKKKEVKRDKSRDKKTSMVKTDKKTSMVKTDKKTSMVKTDKKSCNIINKAVESYCKKPRYIYFRNMITSFILLVGLIGYIKS